MKKLGLLLITLITLTSVSYASFPITDTLQTEEIEPSNSFYIFLSILSALGAIIFAFLTLGSGMEHNGNPFPYLLLTIASVFATIFSAKEARKRDVKRSTSFIGISILTISLLLIKFLIFN